MKSPIKWAGGKSWLVPYLKPTFYLNTRLVEPFAGGLSLALGLEVNSALLNDINSALINFYCCLKNRVSFDINFENTEDCYYRIRNEFNQLKNKTILSAIEKKQLAEYFYYLNRACFNGLYRENSKGGFNVPFGKYKSLKLDFDSVSYANLFSNWHFTSKDFEELDIDNKDYLYLDPPYDSQFSKYHKNDFNWDDQKRLVSWALKHKGPLVISNQATPRILELYQNSGLFIKTLEVSRRIAANGNRDKQLEVIAYKNINIF